VVEKAPDAFRTISEVAHDLELPQHVLRFWETRFQQIKPLKRGGGRRYYRPDDIDLLRGIQYLLYGEGYTIRGAQRILKDLFAGSWIIFFLVSMPVFDTRWMYLNGIRLLAMAKDALKDGEIFTTLPHRIHLLGVRKVLGNGII